MKKHIPDFQNKSRKEAQTIQDKMNEGRTDSQNQLNNINKTLKANDKLYKDKLDVLQDKLNKAIKANGKYFVLGMFVSAIIFAIIYHLC